MSLVDFLAQYGYLGFFIAAFLSATILPFSSELILTGLLVSGASPTLCLVYGTVGNTLGGLTCYWLGSIGKIEWIVKYLRMEPAKVERMQQRVRKWGAAAAFFSFLPIVGDCINVALGFLRSDIRWVTLFMALGKFARYFVWMMMNNFILERI